MKIALISGSMKVNGESARIAKYVEKRIQETMGAETYLLDLGATKSPLPLWDETMWGLDVNTNPKAQEAWAPIKKELASADAYIVFAAEYNGTMPAALKNFFHYLSQDVTGHKPALAFGVSAGVGGTYPIAELHSFAVKNAKMIWTPDHVIVRNANTMLLDTVPAGAEEFDKDLRERIDASLGQLQAYAEGFKTIRASGKALLEKYPFGM